MALRPIRMLLLGLLMGALAACGGSGAPGGGTPTVVPRTGPAGTTASCPPGSQPDTPGPAGQARPPFTNGYAGEKYVSAAFDRQSGRVVVVDSDHGDTWTFNVCANAWERVATQGADQLGRVELLYDPVTDLTYAINAGVGVPAIRTYSVETATWTRVLQPGQAWQQQWESTPEWPRYVIDPTGGIIYGYQPSTGLLRAYDIQANTWAQVAQEEPRPPTTVEPVTSLTPGAAPTDTLMTFDPSVRRIVLSLGQRHEPTLTEEAANGYPYYTSYDQTWTFDPGTGTWARVASEPPLGFPCIMSGTETAFDQASGSSVVFAEGSVDTFDATTAMWSTAAPGTGWPPSTRLDIGWNGTPTGPLARHDHGLVSDPVNGHILVLGGTYRTGVDTWQDGTDVWAYTSATNTWTQLLATQPAR